MLELVPQITSREQVRALLHQDPAWAVYALADLAPAHAGHCRWYSPGPGSKAIALLYSGFDRPIFWASGSVAELQPMSAELFASSGLILQIRPEHAPWLRSHYADVALHPMWRMALQARDFLPLPAAAADVRLRARDLDALEKLYDDGRACGQQPDFFFPEMLESGVFFGAWRDGELVAAAGTHVLSTEESAAAIGNVYTRRDARRRGHAARLTSLVAGELLRRGVATVALSVRQANPAASAVYVKLGFRTHCEFFEGQASR
jgi:ribosomal protein S18 acetylase RimI-like enzyme